MTMRKYTKAQAIEILRTHVAKSSAAKVGIELGLAPNSSGGCPLIGMVLSGQRAISDELTIKVLELLYGHGKWQFVKLPDVFTRIPTKKVG